MSIISPTNNALHTASAAPAEDAAWDATPAPSITAMWRATLHSLSAHSTPMLLCAFAGVAGVYILAQFVNTALTFNVYFRTGGVFTTVYDAHLYAALTGTHRAKVSG